MSIKLDVPFTVMGMEKEQEEHLIVKTDSLRIKDIKTVKKGDLFFVTLSYEFENLKVLKGAEHIKYRVDSNKKGLRYFNKSKSNLWYSLVLKKTASYAALEDFSLEDFEEDDFTFQAGVPVKVLDE